MTQSLKLSRPLHGGHPDLSVNLEGIAIDVALLKGLPASSCARFSSFFTLLEDYGLRFAVFERRVGRGRGQSVHAMVLADERVQMPLHSRCPTGLGLGPSARTGAQAAGSFNISFLSPRPDYEKQSSGSPLAQLPGEAGASRPSPPGAHCIKQTKEHWPSTG